MEEKRSREGKKEVGRGRGRYGGREGGKKKKDKAWKEKKLVYFP